MATSTLHAAAQALADRNADWAEVQNGVGYNKSDSWFGAALAAVPEPEWTDEMRYSAWVMLRKYRGQLSNYGIDFDAIPAPPKPAERGEDDSVTRQVARRQVWDKRGKQEVSASGKIERGGGGFVVSFNYDAATVAKVKEIPGRRFDGQTKTWWVPETEDAVAALGRFSADTGIAAADPETAEFIETFAASYVPKPAKRIELLDADTVKVISPYDVSGQTTTAIKAIGARWDKDKRWWVLKLDGAGAALKAFTDRFGFHVEPDIAERIARDAAVADERREASKALDADLVIHGLGAILHPFQRAGVAYGVGTDTIIGDPMGLGKTPQALAAAQYLDAFPMVAIVPNLAKRNWLREIDFWVPGRTMTLLGGPKEHVTFERIKLAKHLRREYEEKLGDSAVAEQAAFTLQHDDDRRANPQRTIAANNLDADVIVVNYDLISRKPSGRLATALVQWFALHPELKRPDGNAKLYEWLVALRPKALTVDESQYVKNPRAQRTIGVLALATTVRENDGRVWLLSGTPVLNRPVELVEQLNAVGKLEAFGGFWGYVKRYCAAFHDGHGLDTSGASNLAELNRRLRETCYVRREKKDVLTELPPVQRQSLEFPLADPAAYQRVAADVISWVKAKAEREAEFLSGIADLPEAERKRRVREYGQSAAARAERAEILVRLNALRQVAAEQKLPAAIEWLNDWLTDNPDEKIIVFAWHRPIQEKLIAAFPGCARIIADDKPEVRSANEHRFQEQDDCRILIASINVSGVSLTLTAATAVAFSELPWRPGDIDQCEGRAYGRLSDVHGINSWYFLGEETIDVDMAALIDAKREVVDAATSGTRGASGSGILAALVRKLTGFDIVEEEELDAAA